MSREVESSVYDFPFGEDGTVSPMLERAKQLGMTSIGDHTSELTKSGVKIWEIDVRHGECVTGEYEDIITISYKDPEDGKLVTEVWGGLVEIVEFSHDTVDAYRYLQARIGIVRK